MAQLSAACSGANPADAPYRNTPVFRPPDVEGELASLQTAAQLRRVRGNKVKQLLSPISFVVCVWMAAGHTRAYTTLKSIAYCSLKAAAAKRADVKAMAAGGAASQLKAKQMLMDSATNRAEPIHLRDARERDASLRDALLSNGQYCEASDGQYCDALLSLGDRSYDDSGRFG